MCWHVGKFHGWNCVAGGIFSHKQFDKKSPGSCDVIYEIYYATPLQGCNLGNPSWWNMIPCIQNMSRMQWYTHCRLPLCVLSALACFFLFVEQNKLQRDNKIKHFSSIYFSKKNPHGTGMMFFIVFFVGVSGWLENEFFNDSPGPTAHGMQTQLRSMPSATPWAWTMHPWVPRELVVFLGWSECTAPADQQLHLRAENSSPKKPILCLKGFERWSWKDMSSGKSEQGDMAENKKKHPVGSVILNFCMRFLSNTLFFRSIRYIHPTWTFLEDEVLQTRWLVAFILCALTMAHSPLHHFSWKV